MLTRTQKEEQVADLREKLGRATSVIVADYRGVGVQAIDKLRARLKREPGQYEYRVTKNTLLRRAAAGSPAEPLTKLLEGPTAIALGFGDPVSLAKIVVDFAKEHEIFEIRGGYLEGRALDRREIGTLATLPSLEELRGKLVGLLLAPAQRLVGVLAAPGAQLARVVEARRGALEESGSGA